MARCDIHFGGSNDLWQWVTNGYDITFLKMKFRSRNVSLTYFDLLGHVRPGNRSCQFRFDNDPEQRIKLSVVIAQITSTFNARHTKQIFSSLFQVSFTFLVYGLIKTRLALLSSWHKHESLRRIGINDIADWILDNCQRVAWSDNPRFQYFQCDVAVQGVDHEVMDTNFQQ